MKLLILFLALAGCHNPSSADTQKLRNESAVASCLNICSRGVASMAIEYYTVKCECKP